MPRTLAPGHRIFVDCHAGHRQAAELFVGSGQLRRSVNTRSRQGDGVIAKTPAGD